MGHPKSSEASSTSFLNSETADTKTLVEQPRMSTMRHRYLDSWRIVFCSVAAFSLNTLALILNLTLVNNKKYHVFPPAIIGMVAGTLALVSVALDIVFIRSDDKSSNNKDEEGGKKGFFKSIGIMRWPSIRPAIRQAITFLAFVPVIVTMVMLTLQAIDGQGNKFYAYLNTVKAMPRLSLVIVDCLALVSDLVLCAAMARLVWWPVHRAARSSMIISSLLQIAIATILIAINWQPFVGCILKPSIYITATFNLHQHVGAILFTTAMFSFLMCCALREGDRINKVFTRFINIYTVLAGICVVMLFGILGLAIHLLLDKTMKSMIQSATLTSDPILSGCAIFLFMVNFWAANYLQEPPPSSLAVEPIDLADLTSTQRRALAKMIDRHGRAMPDDPTGEAAISLMQAYCAATSLPNMRCMVLRVYKPSKVVDKSVMLNQMVANYSYEDDWAWRGLDLEQAVMKRTIPEEVPLTPIVPKLSKAQQKKLQKKREEAAAKGMPISPMLSPEQIQAELEFRTKLESTEALVMMTQITDYDLTGSVKGIAGKILRKTLGAESPFKFLCVRLGLLAFHWPFRSSTFYTAHAKRPVARSAAVLRAIAEWNAAQPSTERCTVLLDPTYEHGDIDRAIHSSGWQSTPLPASHVIDLRAYKNKSIGEYLKAIKYRDQEANFKKANGEVIESTEFTPQECSEAMRLWHKIAEKRTSDGETAVLATPDEEMLMQLGASNHSASSTNAGAPGDRSLMFLRVDGVNVASCVLFRLGDTITSDLQGLDHDLARPLKAYFVMMQHVIAIALKEGKSFVDFGPTTAKPKMDIGCKSIGLNGAMYATSPLIRFAIGIAAEKTRNALVTSTEAKE